MWDAPSVSCEYVQPGLGNRQIPSQRQWVHCPFEVPLSLPWLSSIVSVNSHGWICFVFSPILNHTKRAPSFLPFSYMCPHCVKSGKYWAPHFLVLCLLSSDYSVTLSQESHTPNRANDFTLPHPLSCFNFSPCWTVCTLEPCWSRPLSLPPTLPHSSSPSCQ